MTHANAPLTPTGRLRMVHRHLHDGIPQAHVAAEFRVSRPTVATWVARYRAEGEAGLQDRSSRPHHCPAQLDIAILAEIEALRRDQKWSARRIHHHLVSEGHQLCLRTVGRWLHRLGISRLPDLAPTGEDLRQRPQKITARGPGHMVHLDVK
ncbi:helix-turn-helix domain-containing protein, partial [Micrococcus luteus]